ncbi:putative hydrolase or acyltransferase (alpha/beta hydrolase superfamily) [Roseovarius mucosus DSM 17069]|uniref:Putative hydrolase or acyltransferase (Alpha/beta hydrolase superfamily) n=1 Tax=Roseovarius mucosus DSM 17069 TaxID=1288298 RepID=A0A0A0HM19_9RHOB|nr:putative hydrolase or acyltransferase (alpha/beta hydrolase superfamily) [Roseovarius mucosus DSM 17069]
MVLIHGLGLSRHSTWGVIAPLLARHFRVLSYDLPGHGQSAPHIRPLTLTILSEQLVTLMDRLALPHAALVGFSLGGMINRRAALDHPARVSALAILNSPHERAPDLQARVATQARDAAAGGPVATIDAALERWFTPRVPRLKPRKGRVHPRNRPRHRPRQLCGASAGIGRGCDRIDPAQAAPDAARPRGHLRKRQRLYPRHGSGHRLGNHPQPVPHPARFAPPGPHRGPAELCGQAHTVSQPACVTLRRCLAQPFIHDPRIHQSGLRMAKGARQMSHGFKPKALP